MQTAVVMKRNLFGNEISQNSKTEMFSATDLVKAGNAWRFQNGLDPFRLQTWLGNKSTKEFIEELEAKYGKENVRVMSRGKGQHTWFHPLLFIDLALAINPRLKIEVYEWLFDHLIKYRNDSGDSYRKMCGSLYSRCSCKSKFPIYISDVATKIQQACGVSDWQRASEEQLRLREKIHNNIFLLADVLSNADEAVRIGILKSKE